MSTDGEWKDSGTVLKVDMTKDERATKILIRKDAILSTKDDGEYLRFELVDYYKEWK